MKLLDPKMYSEKENGEEKVGRPRANSTENILQMKEADDGKSNLLDNSNMILPRRNMVN